jgi:signal peptidase I
VYVNGKALEEPYVRHDDPYTGPYRDNFPADLPEQMFLSLTDGSAMLERARAMLTHADGGELVVPPDFYFAMGDNRDNSLDSRYWGFVPRENIIGKPLFIFWSYDAPTANLVGYSLDHFIDLAGNFFSKTRWNRTFKLIRGYPLQ